MQNHEHQQVSSDTEGVVGSSPTQAQRPSPTAQQGFADVAQNHLAAVVGQILLAEGCTDVSLWQPIITRLALDAAHAVLPSALAAFGVSDPRFYIKVPLQSHIVICCQYCIFAIWRAIVAVLVPLHVLY